jgi:hypothetical protein
MGSICYRDFVIASASRRPVVTVLQDDTPVIGYDHPRITRNDDKRPEREGLCNGCWLATRIRTPLLSSCRSWDLQPSTMQNIGH